MRFATQIYSMVREKGKSKKTRAARQEGGGGGRMRGRMRFMAIASRCYWIIALFALAAIALGCDSRSSSGTAATPSRRVAVLASVYPMAEMVQRIGGAQVDVQWLAETGQRPEEIEPDAELKQRANK